MCEIDIEHAVLASPHTHCDGLPVQRAGQLVGIAMKPQFPEPAHLPDLVAGVYCGCGITAGKRLGLCL
ncbi:hypothetical protein LP415_20895 [Polaromonas sp. P1(28)-8]|nr:hypothetical protein LP415_20895 [Polaromonas sp. P1(28)-8]